MTPEGGTERGEKEGSSVRRTVVIVVAAALGLAVCRARRRSPERQDRGAPGRAALARPLRGRGGRSERSADAERVAHVPAKPPDQGDREARDGDALQAGQARDAAARAASAVPWARRLGRRVARVPAAALRARGEAGRRPVRRGDRRRASALPASPRVAGRRHRRHPHVPGAGAPEATDPGEAEDAAARFASTGCSRARGSRRSRSATGSERQRSRRPTA